MMINRRKEGEKEYSDRRRWKRSKTTRKISRKMRREER
jgi:hypothetical protein